MACDRIYKYQWTEDGAIEYGRISKHKVTSNEKCYHCGCDLMENEEVVLFHCNDGDIYTICLKCSNGLFDK